ncbi:MAG: hypothetical protein HY901_24980 [Deltaproteobacteria bacterium]|nr:hypothetical protein [Deltaproteobacteria bacterium]
MSISLPLPQMVHGIWRLRARALGRLWLAFAIARVLTTGVVLLLALAGGLQKTGLMTASNAATASVGLLSEPLRTSFQAAGVPEFVILLAVNTMALVALFFSVWLTRLADPSKGTQRARRIDEALTRVLLGSLPAYKRAAPGLKGFSWLAVLPYLPPVLIGIQSGLVEAVAIERSPASPMATVAVGLALTLPHGIFELSALMLPGACLAALYRVVEPRVAAGDCPAVVVAMRANTEPRRLLPPFLLGLLCLAVAALVEAYFTLPMGRAVAQALGVEF